MCELCNDSFSDPEKYRIHCQKNREHIELERKFTDETYDFLFKEQLDSQVLKQAPWVYINEVKRGG